MTALQGTPGRRGTGDAIFKQLLVRKFVRSGNDCAPLFVLMLLREVLESTKLQCDFAHGFGREISLHLPRAENPRAFKNSSTDWQSHNMFLATC